jgi:hypothetical protein
MQVMRRSRNEAKLAAVPRQEAPAKRMPAPTTHVLSKIYVFELSIECSQPGAQCLGDLAIYLSVLVGRQVDHVILQTISLESTAQSSIYMLKPNLDLGVSPHGKWLMMHGTA